MIPECYRRKALLSFSACLILAGCANRKEPGPLTPQQALKSFQLNSDFRIELYAAEPHVVDPVEIVFDEDGRAFVAEMRDYPSDPSPGTPPRSRIRLLEDTDGDGQIDRSTIFADQLLQVNSILPWKQGLLATAAPDIIYLKDTDGDGKADIRKVVFTGFSVGSSEHRVSSLRFGVDNWIYAANDGQPGEIKFPERPDAKPLSISGADFRFRLDRGLFETESGPAQFGLAMDDWGHRFMTQNTVHVRHALIPMRYLNRNPYLGAGVVALDISDHGKPSARMFPLTRPQAWRESRTALRQQRYRENNLDRVEYAGGYFTAASGGTIYQGDQFPEAYRGNLFTGDVSGNLVHRDLLEAVGTSFIARRAPEEQDREFLASTDPWFRPCNFAPGPDGNLYVVDMYREFIEGPEFIPEDLRKGMDFYSGDTLGRIYRIVPKNAPPSRSVRPNLGKANSSQLVAALSHPNGWWRLTAQRLLLERQDSSVIPLLRSKVTEDHSALGRLHALYVLEGLSALDASLLESALRDPEAGIREHAVRLAEKFPQHHARLATMVGDSSVAVQFQLALSLGEVPADIVVMPLAKLALTHSEDPWFHTAILSSNPGSSIRLLQTMTRNETISQKTSLAEFVRDLAAVIGARNSFDEISDLVSLLAGERSLKKDEFQAAGLEGLARGLKLAGTNRLKIPHAEALLDRGMKSPSERVQLAARSAARYFELPALVNRAKREALDSSLPPAKRTLAILTLGGGRFAEVRVIMEQLLTSPLETDLLKAAFQCLAGFDDPAVNGMVVTRWKSLGPSVRGDALDVLLSRNQRVSALLDALENGQIERSALDPARKERLLHHPDSEIGQRARRLFQEESSDRAKLVTSYSATLSQKGDSQKGKALFEKHCASCHRIRDGHRIGPDLSGVSSNTKAQLLQSILDPSKTLDPHYINYFVMSKDGRIHDGLIVAETPGTLTLRRAEAEDEAILRSRITGMRASMVSLMPEGFEKDITVSAMADLIAFLQGGVSR